MPARAFLRDERELVLYTLEPLARLDKKPDRVEISSEDLVRVCRRAEDLSSEYKTSLREMQ